MFYNEDHIRVQRPITSDGLQLVIDENTNRPLYKISHLPLSAKKFIEQRNALLPKNLQVKIEVIKGLQYAPAPVAPVVPPESELLKKIAELEARLNAKEPEPVIRKRRTATEMAESNND